jgi:transcriptional regulator with XRE-family HTH domain
MQTGSQADAERVLKVLKSMRHDASLTQAELARRLDVPQSLVSKYESGERRLDVVELLAVCRALGVGLRDFAEQLETTTNAR